MRKNKNGRPIQRLIIISRYICLECGEFNAKCRGHRCKPCGSLAQGKAMTLLYKNNYDEMVSKCNKPYSEETRLKHSNTVKQKILDGKFTPKSNNRRTWKRLYKDGFAFRSSWELKFYNYCLVNDIDVEYESLRIPYEFEGSTHIYITDFISHTEKMVYEIKPNSMMDSKALAKKKYASEWCKENGYEYVFITEDFLCNL
ncbi:endonuclease [Pseudomonas phage PspYZU05]|uniref:TnsA endonuclease N-terminal domain-containing protein n=1 Tax=Pseudomonas phage PspYZU05 TaxID=1983556 RepID=A0A2U7NBU5_9CAUD|nr:endonuclease [Pseudomonas phage PspYZU05]ASD52079.1 hypothetical protein PspYZU05_127 [Pseudomonas phage PspYZU05]